MKPINQYDLVLETDQESTITHIDIQSQSTPPSTDTQLAQYVQIQSNFDALSLPSPKANQYILNSHSFKNNKNNNNNNNKNNNNNNNKNNNNNNNNNNKNNNNNNNNNNKNNNQKSNHSVKILLIIFFIAIFIALVVDVDYLSNRKQINLATYQTVTKYFQNLTAVFLFEQPKISLRSLTTFLLTNPCAKVIIGSHKNQSQQLTAKLPHKQYNIEWVIQERQHYDLYFIDSLIKKVQTPYFLFAKAHYLFKDYQFVDYSIATLQKERVTSQLQIIQDAQSQQMSTVEGFSFEVGIHRKLDYDLLKTGYARVSKQNTENLNIAEKYISKHYTRKGLKVKKLKDNFNVFSLKSFPKEKIQTKQNPKLSQYSQKEQSQSSEVNFDIQDTQSSTFLNKAHNARHYNSLPQYLARNGVKNILFVGIDQNYMSKFTKNSLNVAVTENLSSTKDFIYDWIVFSSLENSAQILKRQKDISVISRFGVSICWKDQKIIESIVKQIRLYLQKKGFFQDEAKSLTLRSVEGKNVLIYLKGPKFSQTTPTFKQFPIKNFLAIHTVFKMPENWPYLREWIIYHINFGVDKFFLYDNTNSEGSPNYPKASKTTNKQGLSFQCLDDSSKSSNSWQQIWAEFYEHIIYVIWSPLDQDNKITDGIANAQRAYLNNYRNDFKYTFFTNVDEFIFSAEDTNLIEFLNHCSNNEFTHIILHARFFDSRFCNPNRRITQTSYYFPFQEGNTWGSKIIAETAYFSPGKSINDGIQTQGTQLKVPILQFRVNNYNFQKDLFEMSRKNRYSASIKFVIDQSMSRIKPEMDRLCKGRCSETFAIDCPFRKQWRNCLDKNKVYPIYAAIPETPTVNPSQDQKNTVTHLPASKRSQQFRNTPSGNHLKNLVSLRQQPQSIYELDIFKAYNKELPICSLVFPTEVYTYEKIQESIIIQSYSNKLVFNAPVSKNGSIVNYFTLFKFLNQNCQENAFVLFVTSPLVLGSLDYMNRNLQKSRSWTIFTETEFGADVIGFYLRIYQMLQTNDFAQRNKKLLQNQNRHAQLMSIMELCSLSSLKLQKQKILVKSSDQSYFSLSYKNQTRIERIPYQKIARLNQDFQTDTNGILRRRQSIPSTKPRPQMKMTAQNMLRALDRQNSLYLPENHTITQQELLDYNRKYDISKFIKDQKQVHFCVTVLSHNNIQNNRYIKVMQSIITQKYSNYHIVFIDDFSTDKTMRSTQEWMQKKGFPRERITYVQNLDRNFATYNILNAAFNYCGSDDIQMLMDGDDEFIGRYAFQVMNSMYQQNQETWVAYSNYKTSTYGYGRSRGLNSQGDIVAGTRRTYISVFGTIRTYRVKVICSIPITHHKMSDGQWLDTVYDDALSHPLFELSGYMRVSYAPQLLYEYNVGYGDNDDSTSQKVKHRSALYRFIIQLTPLSMLDSLNQTTRNPEVDNELKRDLGVRYKKLI